MKKMIRANADTPYMRKSYVHASSVRTQKQRIKIAAQIAQTEQHTPTATDRKNSAHTHTHTLPAMNKTQIEMESYKLFI